VHDTLDRTSVMGGSTPSIHPTAEKGNSPTLISEILHSLGSAPVPMRLGSARPRPDRHSIHN
jgi:hypothetical protein